MKRIGATGGLLAQITTEVATMAAKCTGWTSFAIISGKNSGATTTVTETSSISAPATMSTVITNTIAMSGELPIDDTTDNQGCNHSDTGRLRRRKYPAINTTQNDHRYAQRRKSARAFSYQFSF